MEGKINKYSKNITSQHGEDGILEYILNVIEVPKICCEFGAWDGKFLSNTYNLWHNNGWHGILFEGDKDRVKRLKDEYSKFNLNIFEVYIQRKGKNSIDDIFNKYQLPHNIGIMSIDIDSYDYYVWKNMNNVKPSIIIIEHNHTIPGYVEYVDPEDEVFLRCSAKSLEKLGSEKGYRLICCTVTNSIFIENDLFDNKLFPDKPVEYLFDYSQCCKLRLISTTNFKENHYPSYFGRVSPRQKKFVEYFYFFYSLLTRRTFAFPTKKMKEHMGKFKIS